MKTKSKILIVICLVFNILWTQASGNYLKIDTTKLQRVEEVKKNFKAINSIKKWTKIGSIELSESTEGGIAYFYYKGSELKKIITKNHGEMANETIEFYLLKGQLSFVYRKMEKYNRPIFYDKKSAIENNDTEYFDTKKSKFSHFRYYFHNKKLLQQIIHKNTEFNFSKEKAEDILTEFNSLLKKAK